MLIGERDEMLIQRCVDEELSWEEIRSLLSRLDAIDNGWKSLACGLLEDRRLRRSLRFAENAAPSVVPDVSSLSDRPVVSTESSARRNVQHWWSHPLTSMALCAAIAFVGGVLIPDLRPDDPLNVAATALSGNLPGRISGNSVLSSASPMMDSGATSYRLQMTPDGRTIDVPVYSQPNDLYRQDRDNPLFSRSGNGHGGQVQFLLVPLEENRSIVIPLSEDSHLEMQ